jgi:hypothetical protein
VWEVSPSTGVQPVESGRTEYAIPATTLYMTFWYLATPFRLLPVCLCTGRLTLQLHSVQSVPSVWTECRTIQIKVHESIIKNYCKSSWLRHCATSWKVAGSIPDGVIGIFHLHNPSGRTMALRLTQPLTQMSTRKISWEAKAAGA